MATLRLLPAALGAALLLWSAGSSAQLGELVDPHRLRVCADPANLPYSNQASEGFENKIAEMLAARLGRELVYTWYPQTVGFVRNTLGAGLCDLVIGITTTSELLQNSNPYYRSSYVLLQRAGANPQVGSLHDPALKELRIGAVARTPPVSLLARQGLLGKLKPYQLVVATRFVSPGRDMVEDVAGGDIDIGVLWGPIAGYWARQQQEPLELTPLLGEAQGVRLDFRISMGMRRGEPVWKQTINDLLAANQAEIEAILLDYGVPLLDAQGQPLPGPSGGSDKVKGAVEEPAGYRMAAYRAPVPASLAGATGVDTAGLAALIAGRPPLLIDVLPRPREPAGRPAGSLWQPPRRANLPGSVWLPNVGYGELSAEFERYFREHLARLTGGDPTRRVAFYCQADCWMSWNAARRALAYGYRNVIWYPDGTDGWRAAGLPLVAAEPVPMPGFLPVPARAASAQSG
jgi:quinoprotein dehydrogenase-associated probable ABC transporter substrate-binding protein/PQQ-dependent catabolism-associated CXXCW motif protein